MGPSNRNATPSRLARKGRGKYRINQRSRDDAAISWLAERHHRLSNAGRRSVPVQALPPPPLQPRKEIKRNSSTPHEPTAYRPSTDQTTSYIAIFVVVCVLLQILRRSDVGSTTGSECGAAVERYRRQSVSTAHRTPSTVPRVKGQI